MIPLPCVEAVVDRIEDGWAVVEWCGRSVSELPLDALPVEVAEGDRLRIVARRTRVARDFTQHPGPRPAEKRHARPATHL